MALWHCLNIMLVGTVGKTSWIEWVHRITWVLVGVQMQSISIFHDSCHFPCLIGRK
jgi:hypothetical protein